MNRRLIIFMNEAGKRKIVRMCGVRERMHVERERERKVDVKI